MASTELKIQIDMEEAVKAMKLAQDFSRSMGWPHGKSIADDLEKMAIDDNLVEVHLDNGQMWVQPSEDLVKLLSKYVKTPKIG